MKTLILALSLTGLCLAQLTTTSTTNTSAITDQTGTVFCVASATGVSVPGIGNNGSYFGIDSEAMQVTGLRSTLCYNVKRGQLGTAPSTHANGSTVWVGNPATSSGDSSRPFTGGAFITGKPTGNCTPNLQYTLPVVVFGNANGNRNGQVFTCVAPTASSTVGYWGQISSFWVPPTACTFAPTTLTTTNTYPQIGASNVFVLNGTSNAAAGTNTLTCNIYVPSNVTTSTGAIISDITLFVGSQTTAPTSLGTSTLGTITFPAAATTEVESTVAPVTIGGTVTTTSPTLITTVTTAGGFLTIKHTYSTQVRLSTDLRMLVYKMPFVQSAAAAMALNTPGLLVHYLISPEVNN